MHIPIPLAGYGYFFVILFAPFIGSGNHRIETDVAIRGAKLWLAIISVMQWHRLTPRRLAVWRSNNISAATVSSTGFVKGTGAGNTTISFTTNVGGCIARRNVNV